VLRLGGARQRLCAGLCPYRPRLEELSKRGIDLVGAPAFGTPLQAKEGKLTLVVGGPATAIARVRPVLELLAARIVEVGAAGAAQAAGAIADYLRAAELLAASEAIRLGKRFGFEPAAVLGLASDLRGGGALLRQEDTGLQLGILRRNLDLAARLAVATDMRSPLLEATLAAWTAAEKKLGYGADHTAIAKWLETLPGLKPATASESERKPEALGNATPV
jgi:3-hydroxyisobutyrate dehydrogenase